MLKKNKKTKKNKLLFGSPQKTSVLKDSSSSSFFNCRWLDGKRMDDCAEGLWRIHNTLYDFENFIKLHPGGSDWLRETKVNNLFSK
jgi:hypothetical protein